MNAAHENNKLQNEKSIAKLKRRFGDHLTGMTFGLWGLFFKRNTDDMREAPSITLIDGIFARGGSVQAYDLQAGAACRSLYGLRRDLVTFDSKEAALNDVDCIVICTEWKAFWSPDFEELKTTLQKPVIIDVSMYRWSRFVCSIIAPALSSTLLGVEIHCNIRKRSSHIEANNPNTLL
ncbi:hypothetical protein N9Y37_01900 [Luminiphilus sp.]|nr:hypothetical protein [Luminiphilus sp.]